jgi:hypothetical protein
MSPSWYITRSLPVKQLYWFRVFPGRSTHSQCCIHYCDDQTWQPTLKFLINFIHNNVTSSHPGPNPNYITLFTPNTFAATFCIHDWGCVSHWTPSSTIVRREMTFTVLFTYKSLCKHKRQEKVNYICVWYNVATTTIMLSYKSPYIFRPNQHHVCEVLYQFSPNLLSVDEPTYNSSYPEEHLPMKMFTGQKKFTEGSEIQLPLHYFQENLLAKRLYMYK